ncbi:FkbM family methyltransferase [Butyrivibrio sp. LC3010]|uniref:FkbM family methyltransferase n=1 Tax=Butyrivibrio sp. LC3010 TaxID=1280680 RepID=UPI0003F80D05|nr:FkbM family methyltransferase [Butyrivibrio sp. LC3010]
MSKLMEAIYEDSKEIEYLKEKFITNPLVIVCCGDVGTAAAVWALKKGIKIVGACDASPEKQGKRLMGVEISSVEDIVLKFGNKVNYLIATLQSGLIRAKYRELHRFGIENINIYTRYFIGRWEWGDERFDFNKVINTRAFKVAQKEDEYNEVIELLEDQTSVEVYGKMVSRIFNNSVFTISDKYISHLGYFKHPFFTFNEGEVYIDCGVMDGNTIKEFIEICPNYSHIYAIEADKINYLRSFWVTGKYRDISLIMAAVGEKNEMISFETLGSGISKVAEEGSETVPSIRGDDLNIAPTMIKMDIEGAELGALKGLSHTIKRYKPKLAICIYHSFEDYYTIPIFIHNLVPEYKLYVRNDSDNNNNMETVLYATL